MNEVESKSENKSPVTKRDGVLAFLLVLLAAVAAAALGWVLGWMAGASGSPVGNAAITAVAGIIAALGTREILGSHLNSRAAILKAMSLPLIIAIFSVSVYSGIQWGHTTRPSYNPIYKLLGKPWDDCDPEIVAEVHAFRVRARRAGMLPTDYGQFMLDSVAPVISDDEPNKLERLRAALGTVTAAFPKLEPKADEKPKAEPAKEPKSATEPGKE